MRFQVTKMNEGLAPYSERMGLVLQSTSVSYYAQTFPKRKENYAILDFHKFPLK